MKRNFPRLGTVAGLFLICVFAAALFFALGAGARIYREIGASLEEQYTSRTAVSYVAAKVHACDAGGAVEIQEHGTLHVLALGEEYDGARYTTYIYCFDGYLTELFCAAEEPFDPAAGTTVLALSALSFSRDGALLRVCCATDSAAAEQYVCVSSEGGGV